MLVTIVFETKENATGSCKVEDRSSDPTTTTDL
jgi:hypothetical protein